MIARTTGTQLILATTLMLTACADDPPAPEQPTPPPPPAAGTTSPEASTSDPAPAPTPTPTPTPGGEETMSREQFDAGGSELAGRAMHDWLIAEGAPLPEDAQNLLYELTGQVIQDPTVPWLDEGRSHAGKISELVPIAYPAFDSYTPNFRADDLGQHFQAVALRIDHAAMMDFITGLGYVADLAESPRTPGLLMSGSDDDYFYLVALLDLTQVERAGATGEINDWRQDYVEEIFYPIDVWRTSVEQSG